MALSNPKRLTWLSTAAIRMRLTESEEAIRVFAGINVGEVLLKLDWHVFIMELHSCWSLRLPHSILVLEEHDSDEGHLIWSLKVNSIAHCHLALLRIQDPVLLSGSVVDHTVLSFFAFANVKKSFSEWRTHKISLELSNSGGQFVAQLLALLSSQFIGFTDGILFLLCEGFLNFLGLWHTRSVNLECDIIVRLLFIVWALQIRIQLIKHFLSTIGHDFLRANTLKCKVDTALRASDLVNRLIEIENKLEVFMTFRQVLFQRLLHNGIAWVHVHGRIIIKSI